GERGITVSDFQITQHLVVGAILFDDVDHMMDRIGIPSELDLACAGMQKITVLDRAGELWQVFFNIVDFEASNRAVEQGWNVRMVAMPPLVSHVVRTVVGTGSLAFGSSDQEIIAHSDQSGGIPVSGNETGGRLEWNLGGSGWASESRVRIKSRDRIYRSVGDKKALAVSR